MKTRHVLLAFTFVVLTIFLIIVVSSRSSEMSRLYPDDVVVDAGMLQTTQEPQVSADPNIDVNPAPEDTNRPQDTKPDVDIDSWEYLLANSEHNIGKYSPQVVAIEDSAQYFDERAVSALEDFLNAARAAGYTPYIMTAYRPYSTQEYNYNGKASQISWPDYPDAEDYAEAPSSWRPQAPATTRPASPWTSPTSTTARWTPPRWTRTSSPGSRTTARSTASSSATPAPRSP